MFRSSKEKQSVSGNINFLVVSKYLQVCYVSFSGFKTDCNTLHKMGNCCGHEDKDYSHFDTNEDAFDAAYHEPIRDTTTVRGHSPHQQTIVVESTETLKSQSPSSSKNTNNSSLGFKHDDNTTDFPFFQDAKSMSHIQKSKTMFIMRGPPGCGKSTLVKLIENTYGDTCTLAVCSADHYFMKDGEYQFDFNLLSYAHQDCKDKAILACQEGTNVVIIDNTNIKRWEMQPYIEMARSNGYVVIFVVPKTSWRNDAETLCKRTLHDVNIEDIRKKMNHFEDLIPIYYGWFVSTEDSSRIRNVAKQCLIHCINNVSELSSRLFPDGTTDLSEEKVFEYFRLNGPDMSNKLLHCTAKFMGTNRNPAPGRSEYHSKDIVRTSCGRVYDIKITGITVTSRTLGARVALTNEQLDLYDKPEEAQRNHLKFGSAAHLTVATANHVPAVQTNTDLLDICNIEARNESLRTCPVQGGVLKYLAEDFCVVYFDSDITVNSLFSGFY